MYIYTSRCYVKITKGHVSSINRHNSVSPAEWELQLHHISVYDDETDIHLLLATYVTGTTRDVVHLLFAKFNILSVNSLFEFLNFDLFLRTSSFKQSCCLGKLHFPTLLTTHLRGRLTLSWEASRYPIIIILFASRRPLEN